MLPMRWIELSEKSWDSRLSSWMKGRGGEEIDHLGSTALVGSAGWTERVRLGGMLRSLLWSVRLWVWSVTAEA